MKKNEFLHLSDKLDILDDRISDIDKLLALQHQSLEYHIKRTNIAEDTLDILKTEVLNLKEVKTSVTANLKFIGKVCAYIGALSAFTLVILQIAQALK